MPTDQWSSTNTAKLIFSYLLTHKLSSKCLFFPLTSFQMDPEKRDEKIDKPGISFAKTGNDLLLSELFPNNDGQTSIKHVLSSSSNKIRKLATHTLKSSQLHQEVPVKPRRKRRILSCDNCRKLKTKCVNDNYTSACERCKRLHIECNLQAKSSGAKAELENDTDNASTRLLSILNGATGTDNDEVNIKNSLLHISGELQYRLTNVESNVSSIDEKLNMLITLQQNNLSFQNQQAQLRMQQSQKQQFRQASQDGSFVSNTEASTPSVANFVDLSAHLPLREDLTAPLNLIGKIQSTLIMKPQNVNSKSDFAKAADEFIQFYSENEELCLQLSKEYLEVFHYYIIPGGISAIDRDYVLEHPFITCVFVLIAMTVSKDYKNSDTRKVVQKILKNIISTINGKEPLTDHDIESILYVCMYDIGGFDNWLLSTSGLMHYFVSVDSRGIIDRVVNENIYSDDDLFHLRILNALCACHLQTAIGLGRSIMIDDNWWKVHRLTVIFPNATIGDAIQVAQLDLFKMLLKILKEPEYFHKSRFLDFLEFIDGYNIFQCEDLKNWRAKWEKILSKDVSKISSYSYNFSYVLIARKFVDFNLSEEKKNLNIAFNTASYYSFELLKNFLDSKAEFIKGIPSFQLWEVVYACITLFEYLGNLSLEERKKALNIISRTYWHLNKMGQELNDATGTIAEIIKKLVEMANKNQVLHITTTQDKGFVGSGSVTRNSMYMRRKNSQQQKKLSPEDLPKFMGSEISPTQSSPLQPLNENPVNSSLQRASNKESMPLRGSNNLDSNNDSNEDINDPKASSKKSDLDQYQYQLKMNNWPSVTFSELRTTSTNNTSGKNNTNTGYDTLMASTNSAAGIPTGPSDEVFQLPDLANFSSFDEFFKDLFSEYPT